MSYEIQIAKLKEFTGEGAPMEEIAVATEQLTKLAQMRDAFSLEKILAYAKKVRPVVRIKENIIGLFPDMSSSDLYWIVYSNVSISSYICGAKKIAKAEGLKEIARVKTYHTLGVYASFLSPTVDEIIYQCPKEILDKAVAFEVVCNSHDVIKDCYNKWLNLHVLETIFYEGEMPEVVADFEIKW